MSAPRQHHVSTASAPRRHHVSTTLTPRRHHVDTTSTSRRHHVDTTSTPRRHHVGTTPAAHQHHVSAVGCVAGDPPSFTSTALTECPHYRQARRCRCSLHRNHKRHTYSAPHEACDGVCVCGGGGGSSKPQRPKSVGNSRPLTMTHRGGRARGREEAAGRAREGRRGHDRIPSELKVGQLGDGLQGVSDATVAPHGAVATVV